MNNIQGTKLAGRKWKLLLDAVVTIQKYKKGKFYNIIYIKVFSDENVSYLTVSNDGVLNTTNNETEFSELRSVFEEAFEIKSQEGSVLRYINFRIC